MALSAYPVADCTLRKATLSAEGPRRPSNGTPLDLLSEGAAIAMSWCCQTTFCLPTASCACQSAELMTTATLGCMDRLQVCGLECLLNLILGSQNTKGWPPTTSWWKTVVVGSGNDFLPACSLQATHLCISEGQAHVPCQQAFLEA